MGNNALTEESFSKKRSAKKAKFFVIISGIVATAAIVIVIILFLVGSKKMSPTAEDEVTEVGSPFVEINPEEVLTEAKNSSPDSELSAEELSYNLNNLSVSDLDDAKNVTKTLYEEKIATASSGAAKTILEIEYAKFLVTNGDATSALSILDKISPDNLTDKQKLELYSGYFYAYTESGNQEQADRYEKLLNEANDRLYNSSGEN